MERTVLYPEWIFRGVRMLMRGYEQRAIVGVDTETVKGKPYTCQLWTPDRRWFKTFRNPQDITAWLLDVMATFPSGTAFYAHNLTFDLFVLLYRFRRAFLNSHFLLRGRGLAIEVFYGNVTYALVTLDARHYVVLDTFAFFKAGLGQLAQLFNLRPKLKAPRGLGMKKLKGPAWYEYAMRDAEIAYGVGDAIEKFHAELDVPQTISAPQLAARIFRKHYIPEGESIPCPPRECMRASELAYHGGKNGLYCAPGIYQGVRIYDINSAYPFAFTQLPNFLECDYEWSKRPKKGRHGVVCISGESSGNGYNLLRDHRFERIEGTFSQVWVTTYELELAIRRRFVKDLEIHESWNVIPRRAANPLDAFARDYYSRKNGSKGSQREFFKLILNSLYGKFIQNIRDDEKDFVLNERDKIEQADTDHIAGGLYNPLLAALITGFVRAYLTRIELASHSLHSSTDSVVTTRRLSTSRNMGDLSLKTQGACVLLRPKLYVAWDRDRAVTHFALHGFHGALSQLLALLRSGKRGYKHVRMLKVKESDRDGTTPLTMQTFFKTINLPFSGALDIPALTWKGRKV